jgi:hypothetical protein
VLSGRVLITPAVAAVLQQREVGLGFVDGLSDERWPNEGDVRLDMTLEVFHRDGHAALPGAPAPPATTRPPSPPSSPPAANRHGPLHILPEKPGFVNAAIFNEVAWHRLDLSSLSSIRRFTDFTQLEGALRWITSAVRAAKGRECRRQFDSGGAQRGFTVTPLDKAREPHGVDGARASLNEASHNGPPPASPAPPAPQ